MKAIDFSSKHNILIRNEDGSLRPMDKPYFEPKLIAPGTWQILSDGDYTYLVEGDNEALVIDSGYGCGNIRDFCQTLTNKPVRNIANTHGHFDHTANNCYFECAYMSADIKKNLDHPFPSFDGIKFPGDYPITLIGEGYKFHLGNRDLDVIEIPDHAPGSLAYLDNRERILFSGDELSSPAKRINGSVAKVERQLLKLKVRRNEFDRLCGGSTISETSLVEKYLANVQYILAGHEGEGEVLQNWPPRPAVPAHPNFSGVTIYERRAARPCDSKPNNITYLRVMNYAGCRIIYDIRHIHD